MAKRVHEIAKQNDMAPKDLLAKLQAAGVKAKAASSSVDEQVAARVLAGDTPAGDGGTAVEQPGNLAAERQAIARQEAAARQAAAREAAARQAAVEAAKAKARAAETAANGNGNGNGNGRAAT